MNAIDHIPSCREKDVKIHQVDQTTIVQILGFVKDEHCFSTLSFMKIKFKNWLTIHLDVVIQMFAQNFETFEIFFMIKLLKSGRLPIANMQLMLNYFSLILGKNIFILWVG